MYFELSNILLHTCARCQGNGFSNDWILDSGASMHFKNSIKDYIDFYPLDEPIKVSTAKKGVHTLILGVGTVLVHHDLERRSVVTKLDKVWYIPDLHLKLLSIWEILKCGHIIHGSQGRIISLNKKDAPIMVYWPHAVDQNIYWLFCRPIQ